MRNCQFTAVKDRGQIDMEHFFPVLCTHILKETDIGDTGIVDQNVCSSKLFFYLFKPFFTAFYIAHISHIGQTGHLIALDFLLRLQKTFFAVHTAYGYIISLFCKFDCDCFPDATGCPGDQYCFSCHTQNHPFQILPYYIIFWQGKPCIPF